MEESKEYLVNQCLITQSKRDNHNVDITVECVVRFVNANTKEEAIGKFVTQTASIKPLAQRLPIECHLSKDYVRIN